MTQKNTDANVVWLVKSNFPNEEQAHQCARGLLAEKLAACVNVIPNIQSFYWWDGKITEDREVTMLIKTAEPFQERVVDYIATHHPYQIPEILAWPITIVNPNYQNWLYQSLQTPNNP